MGANRLRRVLPAHIAYAEPAVRVTDEEIEQDLAEIADWLREQTPDGGIPALERVEAPCPRCKGASAKVGCFCDTCLGGGVVSRLPVRA